MARQICPEFRLSAKEAEVVGTELRRLGAETDAAGRLHGLSARRIVDAARKKNSPLHRYIFGQTDAAVLRVARETLARKLVNSVRIEVELVSGEHEKQPLMVHVKPTPTERRGYVATDVAQASAYMTDQKCAEAIHRLNGWLDEFRAFRHGTKITPLWDGVRELLKTNGLLEDAEQRTEKITLRRTSKRQRSEANPS